MKKRSVHKIEKWTLYYGDEKPYTFYINRNIHTGEGKTIKPNKKQKKTYNKGVIK